MNARSLQLFFLFTFCFLSCALTETGEKKIYALKFTDIDGRELSTADGHVTLLVFVNSGQVDKAQTVGDRVPDFCLGNNGYRMITVIEAKNHSAPLHRAFESVARHRLDAVAKRLQTRYDKKKIARNARLMFSRSSISAEPSVRDSRTSHRFRIFELSCWVATEVYGNNGSSYPLPSN